LTGCAPFYPSFRGRFDARNLPMSSLFKYPVRVRRGTGGICPAVETTEANFPLPTFLPPYGPFPVLPYRLGSTSLGMVIPPVSRIFQPSFDIDLVTARSRGWSPLSCCVIVISGSPYKGKPFLYIVWTGRGQGTWVMKTLLSPFFSAPVY